MIIDMTFTVLFWNIWLENQIKGEANATSLIKEFANLIDRYKPDVIGLNELLKHTDHIEPYILKILKTHGYAHTHFAPASPHTKDWIIGTGIASKTPFIKLRELELGYDSPAHKRGFPGHTVKTIVCDMRFGGQTVNIIVTHLMHLRPYTLKDHLKQAQTLKSYLDKHAAQGTIIGGDFNEPNFMLNSFKKQVKRMMNYRSGTRIRPTWSHNGTKLTPIRANLDQLYWSKNSDFELEKFEIVNSRVSDHKPIYAVYEFA